MANLNETDDWAAGIYQIEEDDPVLGGPAGITNQPPTQLASRTRFQRVRNVTPWVATLAYPASLAFVSHAGTTWKSVAASTAVEPGTDDTKWTRWAHTEAELNALLSESAVRFDEAQTLTNPQKVQARTNIGAEATGVAATEVQKGSARYGIDTGAANACEAAYTPAITALVDGMVLWFKVAAANTGATTLNVDGLGAAPVVGLAHAELQGGEIISNGRCQVVYNATLSSFVLIECTGAALQVGAAKNSNQAMQLGQATGRLLRTLRYSKVAGVQYVSVNGAANTTVGAGEYVPSADMVLADVEVQGGGGGGGGASNPGAGQMGLGAPGACGSYARSIFLAATIGASVSINIGNGGAGNSASAGGTGGTTSFGALVTAPGGGGGATLNNSPVPASFGSNAGTAAPSGANLYASTGAGGSPTMAVVTGTTAFGGQGGGTSFGVAQPYAAANTNGISAFSYGCGGSGVAINSGFGPANGSTGATGVIFVREYA